MALDKRYQGFVKDAGGVLVGVSQIRVGLPSVRAAGVLTGSATIKAVQQVPDSTISTVVGTDGSTLVDLVIPGTTITAATASLAMASSGTAYSGAYDGAFIIRYNGATYDIFAPNGYKDAAVAASAITAGYDMKLAAATMSGAKITGTLTTPASGLTFIVPVWSSAATDKVQTGIVCPYSPFLADNNSVGGIVSASWDPQLEDVKKLTSGFPEITIDSIVAKTTVGIKFEAQEYENTNISRLVDMIDSTINKSSLAAISIEVVMRTRGGSLRTFWHPNCALDKLPSIAPTNDYSKLSWEFTAQKQTEIAGESVVYNTWLSNANIYNPLSYLH